MARGDERAQIWALGLIDRGRNGDDVEIRVLEARDVGGVGDLRGVREFLLGHLAGAVEALAELGHALLVDVEAEHGKMPGEIDGERQPDIAKADHANSYILEGRQRHSCFRRE